MNFISEQSGIKGRVWVLGQTGQGLKPGPATFELNLVKVCPFLGLICRKATAERASWIDAVQTESIWRWAGQSAVGVTGGHGGRTVWKDPERELPRVRFCYIAE